MSKKKDELLKGGIRALFGESGDEATPEQQAPAPEETAPDVDLSEFQGSDLDKSIIGSIEDRELQESLRNYRLEKARRGRKMMHQNGSGIPEGYKRATFVLSIKKPRKLHYIAMHETITLKDLMDEALSIAIAKYEKRYGKIVLPEDRRKQKTAKEIFK